MVSSCVSIADSPVKPFPHQLWVNEGQVDYGLLATFNVGRVRPCISELQLQGGEGFEECVSSGVGLHDPPFRRSGVPSYYHGYLRGSSPNDDGETSWISRWCHSEGDSSRICVLMQFPPILLELNGRSLSAAIEPSDFDIIRGYNTWPDLCRNRCGHLIDSSMFLMVINS